jgi:hypothetical protein
MCNPAQLDLFPNEIVMIDYAQGDNDLESNFRVKFGTRTEICKAYRVKKKTLRWLVEEHNVKSIFDKDGKTKLFKWHEVDLPIMSYKQSTKKSPPVNHFLLCSHFLESDSND